MEASPAKRNHRTKRSTYALVFGVLVFLTAIEVALTLSAVPRQTLTVLFIVLSLGKASLVGAFYMHLKDDPPIYTYVFVLPAALLLIFILMSSLY